ncbi:DnaJ-domain-containing protein [Punctularia strigosozonata HHB-11173 SS5]|uniref:DnaJ-domain-containing protein n=1 Tax=Punctularia strigosozonata (strain HHB-11173) TaxID=741275 RepID=R7S2N7_PUNST|nr:DnaJ-domain-containing protein [Punctularia strigosozonata HHB-11173 SS5]EIN04114.1 DnaJ-domain-containing protein [Punctularia strigosozonata HHB-11173 SS5]
MSFTYPVLDTRPLTPHVHSQCAACSAPFEFDVPAPAPRPGTLLQIRCFKCGKVERHAFYPGQVAGPSGSAAGSYEKAGAGERTSMGTGAGAGKAAARRGRKIGTQENPLETGYYDLLGVSVLATDEEIKKAYRRLAIKHHPDKNRDDPLAEERFKEIAIAYQTLSDPALRKKYNEFGSKESAPEGGFVDPEEVFGAMFGGEKFVPIIGHISLARDMKTALQEAEEVDENGNPKEVQRDAKGKEILTPEEKAKKEEKERKVAAEVSRNFAFKAAARKERVDKLVDNLERKLAIFAEQAQGPEDPEVTRSWRTICSIEAEQLKDESYGVELLQVIGFTYVAKAKQYLASHTTWMGVGGWLHNVQGKYHVFSETVSTLRSAIELKGVFDQIQAAEKAGNLSPEERRKLEEQAAEKGLQALFKGAKLEIESILRETCERVLDDQSVPPWKRQLRAVALQIMGEAYMAVRKEGEEGDTENEYVRIETKASRERDSRRSSKQG